MENEHLHLLINEEIYVIEGQATSEKLQENIEKPTVSSPQPDKVIESTKGEVKEVESIPQIKIAFIHNSDKPEELELLNKIIGACKLNSQNFKVLKKGEPIQYEKAIIFTNSANSYYQSSRTPEGEVIHSKPLTELNSSPEEKGKLWSALKEFLGA